jgi:predicted PurR-regulated permease PerM
LGFKARGFRESGIISEQQFLSNGSNMSFPDRRTVDVLLTTLLFMGVCSLVYSARRVILVFVVSILFAYLINPIVRFIEGHSLFFRTLRGPAVVEVYLLLLIFVAIPARTLVPALLRQTSALRDAVPVLLSDHPDEELVTEVGSRYGWTDLQEVRLKAFLAGHRDDLRGLVLNAEHQLPTVAQALGSVLVIPILAIFFLREGGDLANSFILFASTRGRSEPVRALAEKLDAAMKNYIKAKVILGSLSLVVYSVTMLLCGVPYAVILGICGGVLDCIPVAGGIVAAAMMISFGVLTHSHWIWMSVLLVGWRVAQDYFIAPRVMGRNLEIHPLMAIFGVMAGWEIGGVVGVYLAFPLMAAASVVWRSYISSKSSLHHRPGTYEQTHPPGVLSADKSLR